MSSSKIFSSTVFRMQEVLDTDIEEYDPMFPPYQPGADVYQSPLTVNVFKPLPALQIALEQCLRICCMEFDYDPVKFKYKVAACYSFGACSLFSVRIWTRSKAPEAYGVEVLRDRGDRFLMLRIFELLRNMLGTEARVPEFSEALFDWHPSVVPRKEPSDDFVHNDEEDEQHANTLAEMLATGFDDIAFNALTTIARLFWLPGCQLQKQQELVDELKRVAVSAENVYSWETRALAVMILRRAELTEDDVCSIQAAVSPLTCASRLFARFAADL